MASKEKDSTFRVEQHAALDDLVSAVDEMMATGWEPIGFAVDNQSFMVAMTKGRSKIQGPTLRESITITATAEGEGIPESWRAELSRALDEAIDVFLDDIEAYFVEELEEPQGEVVLKVGAEPAR